MGHNWGLPDALDSNQPRAETDEARSHKVGKRCKSPAKGASP